MQIVRLGGINSPGKSDGCEKSPNEILNALDSLGSNEKGKLLDKKLFDLEEIHVDNKNLEEANELIYKNAKNIFSEQDKVVFLGGDHSISYSLVKGFADSFENPFLIVFDAHADCMKPGKEPTHEEWLRKLVERGFSPENIMLLGTRNIWPEERVFLDKHKIKVISMREIQEDKEGICDMIMERAKDKDFYVSIDIDVLDPSFAPGTGYLEPGGLSSRDLIYFLQRLSLLKNFKSVDIVEINAETDKKFDSRTVKLGAKLLGEMI